MQAGGIERGVDPAPALHVSREHAQGQPGDVAPCDARPAFEHRCFTPDEDIALPKQRQGLEVLEAFVVQVADADIELETGNPAQDFGCRERMDLVAHPGIPLQATFGEQRNDRQRGGYRTDAQHAGGVADRRSRLLAQAFAFGQGPTRPGQHAFTVHREALEAPAALHDGHAELFLDASNRP